MKWNLVCSNKDPEIQDQRPHKYLLQALKCNTERLGEAVLEAFHRVKKPALRYGVCSCRHQWGFCFYCTQQLQFQHMGQTCSSESNTYHQHGEECQPEESLQDIFVDSSNTPNIQPWPPSYHTLHLARTNLLGKLNHWLAVSVPQTQLGGSGQLQEGSLTWGCRLRMCPSAYSYNSPDFSWGSLPVCGVGLLSLVRSHSYETEQSNMVTGFYLGSVFSLLPSLHNLSMLPTKSPACFLSREGFRIKRFLLIFISWLEQSGQRKRLRTSLGAWGWHENLGHMVECSRILDACLQGSELAKLCSAWGLKGEAKGPNLLFWMPQR